MLTDKINKLVINSIKNNCYCHHCNINNFCFPFLLNNKEILLLNSINKTMVTIKKKELIFSAGDKIKYIFIIKSGSIKKYIVNNLGNEQIIGFYYPGHFLDYDAFFTSKYLNYVETLENVTLCKIPFLALNRIINKIYKLRIYFFRSISIEIKKEQNIILLLSKKTALEKVASFIYYISQRWKKRGLSKKFFKLPMSRNDISNYLGLTVETISRMLSKLKKKKIINVYGKYIIINSFESLYIIIKKNSFIYF